jgi:hypothetical protein
MSYSVQQREPGYFMDFHPAPFRRWQVGLAGRTKIGLSDGTSHTFGPAMCASSKTLPAKVIRRRTWMG